MNTNKQERYAVYRFYSSGRKAKFIQYVYSREQAQEWCSDPKTRKEGKWFDGFRKE